MKSARVWLLLALLPLLVGCVRFPTIYSKQPLGEPAVLDPEKWNGRWLHSNGEVVTWTVVGTDTLAGTKRGEPYCDPSPSDMDRASLREFQDWYILYKDNDEFLIRDGLYVASWLIQLEGRTIYGSSINEQRVKALVEQGELPGRIEADRVILGALTKEQHKLLFHARAKKVEYPMAAKDDHPDVGREAVAIKLPDELDPCKKGDKGK